MDLSQFNISALGGVLLIAIMAEAIVENIMWTYESFKKQEGAGWNPQRLLALVIAVAVAVLYNVDALAFLGFETPVPYVGAVLTGLIFARGANFFSDVMAKLGG